MIRLLSARLHRLELRARMPFRYGIATMTDVPQVILRAEFALDDKRHSAWSNARSTKLVPNVVSSGGRRRAAPHADCAASSSRQNANAVGARRSLA